MLEDCYLFDDDSYWVLCFSFLFFDTLIFSRCGNTVTALATAACPPTIGLSPVDPIRYWIGRLALHPIQVPPSGVRLRVNSSTVNAKHAKSICIPGSSTGRVVGDRRRLGVQAGHVEAMCISDVLSVSFPAAGVCAMN